MIVSVHIKEGAFRVDDVPWSDRQVSQALEDARACMESRGAPDPARRSGVRPAAPCECVCCRIWKLRRHAASKSGRARVSLAKFDGRRML